MVPRPVYRFTFCLLSLIFGIAVSVKCQLTVTPQTNPSIMVNNITGLGLLTSNPLLTCPGTFASGTFVGTNSNIGLQSGVILTTGNISNAIGPNNSGSTGTDNFMPGDTNLNQIAAPDLTLDACALSFDLVAICDTLEIRFVFASEEYDEYVCANVNDLFGFFIQGPGYPTPTNIALVPGTSIPFSINTVNNGSIGMFGTNGPGCNLSNSAFFTSNSGGPTVQFDGFSIPVTAKALVVPCATYHVKLVIADVGDGIFDSGLFFEELGFRCSELSLPMGVDANGIMIEGCQNDTLRFSRSGNISSAVAQNYTFGGTATNGLDYTGLSGSVIFQPNSATATIPLAAVQDGLMEGTETLWVAIADSFCGTLFSDTVFIQIMDASTLNAGPDKTACGSDSVMVGIPNAIPGSFNWSPSGAFGTPNSPQSMVAFNSPGIHTCVLTYTSQQGCISTDTVRVQTHQAPVASFQVSGPVCQGTPAVVTFTGSASPTATYNWNFGSGNVISGNGAGPYYVAWTSPLSQWITLSITDSACTSNTDSVLVIPFASPTAEIGSPAYAPCMGDTFPLFNLNPGLSCLWSTGAQANTINVTSGGTYSLTVFGSNGCNATDTLSVVFHPLPNPTITQQGDTLFCNQGYLAYLWYLNGSPIPGATNYYYVPSVNGSYSVQVSDSFCTNVSNQSFYTIDIQEGQNRDIRVSPNPFDQSIQVEFLAGIPTEGKITLFDLLGRSLQEHPIHSSAGLTTWVLDMSTVESGAYILLIRFPDGIWAQKLLKQ